MDSIYKTLKGTYVDLSKIVAIESIDYHPYAGYSGTLVQGFKVHFQLTTEHLLIHNEVKWLQYEDKNDPIVLEWHADLITKWKEYKDENP